MTACNFFRLKFTIFCLVLPFIGYAQGDTTRRNLNYKQTYQLTGMFNQKISKIPAFNDYEHGMAAAKKTSKPALIYFNGYGSVSARKVDEEILAKPEIKDIIDSKFQLIVLFVDDPTLLPVEKRIMSKSLNRIMKTVGDYNANLQIATFEDNRQPVFFIVDPEKEKKIDSILTTNKKDFHKFLTRGSN